MRTPALIPPASLIRRGVGSAPVPRFSEDAKITALRRAPLFADLSKKELTEVARLADDAEVPAGTVICREGETGQEFFVVVDGEAEFTRDGRVLPVDGPVDFFGE